MTNLLDDIEDDLSFLAGLRQHWCAEEETGKSEELQETGVRDGARPHLLPCLRRRYSQDCRDCDEWWAELCRSSGLDLHAPPTQERRALSQHKRRPLSQRPGSR